MQEDAISCVLEPTQKMRHFYSVIICNEQKILEVVIENNLNLKIHINELCKKAS